MRGRLVLNGSTDIRGSFAESSANDVTLAKSIWLRTTVPLTAGDTVELQGYFRVAESYNPTMSGYYHTDPEATEAVMHPSSTLLRMIEQAAGT